jgi:hypothetical protein
MDIFMPTIIDHCTPCVCAQGKGHASMWNMLINNISMTMQEFQSVSADYAVLATSTDSREWTEFCSIYNSDATQVPVANAPLVGNKLEAVYSDEDIFGCTDLSPNDTVDGKALIVNRGNCTFVQKALVAQSAGARLVVVVYNESQVWTVPDLQVDKNETPINIPVLLISNVTGENIWVSMKLFSRSVIIIIIVIVVLRI